MAGVISSLFISRNQYENTKHSVNFNVCKNNVIFYEYSPVKIECFKCCWKMNVDTLVIWMKPLLFLPFFFFFKVIAYGPGTTEKSKKNSDIWIWQLVCGNSHLLTDDFIFQFRLNCSKAF